MNLSINNAMIFVNEVEGKKHYKTGISTKKQDGSYENAYIDVKMPKDTNLQNQTKINITKGFLTFYNYYDMKTKKPYKTVWYIVVLEYNKVESNEVTVIHNITAEELDDLPLPF